jgi:acyl-CoA synthetase (AMP-forming)/AMP-acid ligase II
MRQVENPRARYDYAMRSIGSGGEALGEDILDWCRETFGFDVNEFYGQTEANLLVGNCSSVFPIRPGSMGRAIPGHDVEIVSPQGEVLPDGEIGVIAGPRPAPVMFIEYWRQPEATAAKFAGNWCLTGDIGIKDEDGYFWYKGLEDDLISSGGYRIGPTDIEDCILAHPAVLWSRWLARRTQFAGDCQSLHRPAPGDFGRAEAGRRNSSLRARSSRRLPISSCYRVRRRPADDGNRKDHATRVAPAKRSTFRLRAHPAKFGFIARYLQKDAWA